MLGLATSCCVCTMYKNVLLFWRMRLASRDEQVYVYSCNKMAALGYVYTLGKQTLHSPECCTSQNATSAEFLRFRYLCVSSCMAGIRRCTVSSARNNLVGRTIIIIIRWKDETGVTVTTTLFPHVNSRLSLGTFSYLAPWNKPIHGL